MDTDSDYSFAIISLLIIFVAIICGISPGRFLRFISADQSSLSYQNAGHDAEPVKGVLALLFSWEKSCLHFLMSVPLFLFFPPPHNELVDLGKYSAAQDEIKTSKCVVRQAYF